jgi:hypothetical protein
MQIDSAVASTVASATAFGAVVPTSSFNFPRAYSPFSRQSHLHLLQFGRGARLNGLTPGQAKLGPRWTPLGTSRRQMFS